MAHIAFSIYQEIARVEAILDDPVASKGQVSLLKAYHRKLGREYYKLVGAK